MYVVLPTFALKSPRIILMSKLGTLGLYFVLINYKNLLISPLVFHLLRACTFIKVQENHLVFSLI